MGNYYLISTLLLLVFMAVSWITTGLLHLSGPMETAVRSILLAAGFSIYGYITYQFTEKKRRRGAEAEGRAPETPAGEPEIDYLLRQSESRLGNAQLGRNVKLGTLPVVFLLGDTGSAKTSIFVHSGIEPDLLAGQVYQDQAIIPTRPANFWLARRTVFIEAGGRLLTRSERWIHLIKRLQPKRLRAIFGSAPQAPRAALVCMDTEAFMKPGAEDGLGATARNLNARLGEISQTVGASIPVYVLFTKLDRLSFFTEFVGNLRDEEIHRVLGVTLPIRSGAEDGVYAEAEARRLTATFNDLFYSLCDKRPTFLLREHDEAKLPRVYEFPREFRKLRQSLVRFLVDLGKPSQLRANPFLRGFYFSGVRPRAIDEVTPAATVARPASGGIARDAIGLFDADHGFGTEAVKAPAATVRTRRVPQWLFLGHLFGDVILQDRVALSASGVSARTELVRRLLPAAGSLLLAGLAIGMTASWMGNRALESRVTDAARGISLAEPGGGAQQLPPLDSLERLETLRQSVQLLSRYAQEGPPLSLRWGLYIGDEIFPAARRLYFARFHQILFGATQTSLLDWLRRLPMKPGREDSYKYTYDTLKGYLITTSHPDKSTKLFLTPLLMERWLAGRDIDGQRRSLAEKQFDFYAEELLRGNPFSKENDSEAVEHSRYYLAQFNAIESIYQYILSEAARQKPAVNFNKMFPRSAAYVVNNKDVSGAFTAEGWLFVQDAIKNLKRFFGGERWVLGEKAYEDLDPAKVAPELVKRYSTDFLANWRTYLANSEVARFTSIGDAAQKLAQLASNQSFLMSLFCLATNNTINAPDEVKAPYQPVHYVQPSGCTERPVRETISPYLSALTALQTSLDRVAKSASSPDESAIQQTLNDATSGYRVTRQIAQNFRIDKDGNVHTMVQKLMEDPIRYAEGVVGRLGPSQLNTEGRRLCMPFAELSRKYPFLTSSREDATLPEIEAIFRPGDGKLAVFYENSLKNYVERRGNQIFAKPDSKVRVTEGFLRFFNRALAFSDALYKDGRTPKISYSMKALPAPGLKSMTLMLDGQTLQSTAGGESKDFVWPGAGTQAARLAGSLGGSELSFITYDGLWAAFRLFGDADRFQATGAGYTLQWVPRQGQSGQPIRLENGNELKLTYFLDLKGAPPVFQKGYLASVQCVSEVAR